MLLQILLGKRPGIDTFQIQTKNQTKKLQPNIAITLGYKGKYLSLFLQHTLIRSGTLELP